MICKDFQHWLLARDEFTDKITPAAQEHLESCENCKALYNIDLGLEKSIQAAFFQEELPKGLFDQIELTLDHAKTPILYAKQKIAGIVAGFALIIAMVFMVFFNPPFRYQNLQQLSEKAVASHLKGNTAMSFTGDQIEQALSMLSKELKFNVILPDLTDKGYVLLGGRLCVLGECRTAYLFYQNQDKVSSVFILDYDHLDFEMADGSRFENDIKGCHTDIWKEKGQVYAMVY
ncbi:MAG: hypothetical protein KKE44_12905 [Proteobacteria bacterium]|nr:hypothetical protein [Pseudomonadota bacterium]MBU1583625.1 hypothetical protein [Pseudomonadota bacterium]MBU2456076.1 hypothetical protein [Pseudomonadota bacterium]MBU2629729.1 hypothetical protein [Pseudomonadota bacterium]